MKRSWELGLLVLVLGIGAWLRFSHWDLLEFKADEAYAAHLALGFVKGGDLPSAGLMSSVGVTNPPLFIWLLIPLFLVTTNLTAVSLMIAALGLAAVLAAWWIGRKYYGPFTGLVAAALFAVSPWAVIYSRKIWAQDFVPLLAVATIWAVHALVLGRKPKAVFWVLFLPLSLIQIHYSGFALTAVALAVLLVLRPRIDWRFAAAGSLAAVLLAVPYVLHQQRNGWTEWQRMAAQRSSARWSQLPSGLTINPYSGYPFPRSPANGWQHALAIMNSGQIEDILGLSTSAEFDKANVWAAKGRSYFVADLTLGGAVPMLQRLGFLGVLVWLLRLLVRERGGLWRRQVSLSPDAQRAWILMLWFVVPVLAYAVAGLWTYLSYYVILYPVFFLALGWAADRLPRPGALAAVAVVLVGNLLFMNDLYRFLDRHGGAQGTYGSGLGYKQQLAQYLASQADAAQLHQQQRLLQLDQIIEGQPRFEPAQLDLPFLASQLPSRGPLPTNTVVLVLDENRTNFDPNRANFGGITTNFGPLRVQLLTRP